MSVSAERAAALRRRVIEIAAGRGQGYVGQGLGVADLLACLHFGELEPERGDRFVLSPGHYAIALYAVGGELGLYDDAELATYGMDGSRIEESPLEGLPGFEITGGSLGQGLSQAAGMALAARRRESEARVFVLVSDGELEEGSTWEAAMFASHYRLANLVALIDANGQQIDGPTESVMSVEPISERFEAFGWRACVIDGHDHEAIAQALASTRQRGDKPTAVICRTKLGKGVERFEQASFPHYLRLPAQEWQDALDHLAR
jgi:transketolase